MQERGFSKKITIKLHSPDAPLRFTGQDAKLTVSPKESLPTGNGEQCSDTPYPQQMAVGEDREVTKIIMWRLKWVGRKERREGRRKGGGREERATGRKAGKERRVGGREMVTEIPMGTHSLLPLSLISS